MATAVIALALAAPMLAFLGTSPAVAASLAFNPDADAKVQAANPTTNYGTSPTLKVDGGTDPIIESYLKFTVAGASSGVTSATLKVFTSTSTTNGPAVYSASNSWSESGTNGVTYNTRPTRTSSASDDKGAVPASAWVSFDVTPLVTGNGTYTFDLATDSTDGMTFSSREGTTKPELDVSTSSTSDQPPSVPTNLKATAISATRVDLTWNAATDDHGVTGYNIYRDNVVITTVGAVTSYSDTTARAGTQYSYQVEAIDTANQKSGPSTAVVVTTPSGGGSDPVIGAAGDIACNTLTAGSTSCHQQATANLLSDVNAVLPLGDEQYDNATLTEFQSYYDKSWGKYLFMSFPTVGNHEYYVSSTAQGYFDYFGAKAGPRPQGYYSWNIGAWHMISLNANCSKVGGCASTSAQYQWLQSDLAANPVKCTLAYWHQPLFGTNGGNSTVKPLWDALYAAHADIVLNGHEHHYERFAPQTPSGSANSAGIREFVVGTGGKSLGGFGSATPSATSQVRNSNTFGVLKLTLHPTSYDWRFVPEAGKTFTDSGASNCV
jgi:acid phosphatase type 7